MGHIRITYGFDIHGNDAEFLVNLDHIQYLVSIIHNFAVSYAAPDSFPMIDPILISLNIQFIPIMHVVWSHYCHNLVLVTGVLPKPILTLIS